MTRQTRLKQKQQSQKRVPAPKQRREPLPIAISVKHHLPLNAEGTATDLTVAEIETAMRNAAMETAMLHAAREAVANIARNQSKLDYSSSQAANPLSTPAISPDRSIVKNRSDRTDHSDRNQPIDHFDHSDRSDPRINPSELRMDRRDERSDRTDQRRDQTDQRIDRGFDQRFDQVDRAALIDRRIDLIDDQIDLVDHRERIKARDQFDPLDQLVQFDPFDPPHQQPHHESKQRSENNNRSNDRTGNRANNRSTHPNNRAGEARAQNPTRENPGSRRKDPHNNQQLRSNDQGLPHKSERSFEQIDLRVESKFVRVPNAIADQLARQLSPAEEKIFDQIWRLTVGFNREIWRGKISDLMLRTGYSSRATVTKAIAGLSALGLVIIEGRDTNPRGRSYRIIDHAQLLDYPTKSNSTTNSTTNSIKKPATSHAESSRLVEPIRIDPIADLPENKAPKSSPSSTSRAFKDNFERHDDNSGYSPSSSSCEDDENASQVRLIYQDLTSNSWSKGDEVSYREIEDVPLPYVILGICYSITRVADHRVGSLKYCLPSIREHRELMRAFPHKDLLEIAYRHIVRVKEAQRTGRWIKQD